MAALNNSRSVRVVMDPRKVDAFVKGPEGPVFRHLMVQATKFQEAARRQVRLGHVASGGRVNLRYTIVKRVIHGPHGPTIRVGSNSPIALIHHEGTRPHLIRPVKAKMLRFPGKSGGFVFAHQVHHPGTKPNRFLTDNLHILKE